MLVCHCMCVAGSPIPVGGRSRFVSSVVCLYTIMLLWVVGLCSLILIVFESGILWEVVVDVVVLSPKRGVSCLRPVIFQSPHLG